MVLIETPEVMSFDPTPSVHLWNYRSVRPRRPDFMESGTLSFKYANHLCQENLLRLEERTHNLLSAALVIAKDVAQSDNSPSDCEECC